MWEPYQVGKLIKAADGETVEAIIAIPVVGLLDNATVMSFLIDMLGDKLDEYEEMCMDSTMDGTIY